MLGRDLVLAGMAPLAIVAAGAGAALGILVGGGVVGALTLAVVAWVLAVAIPVGRRHLRTKGERIDPFALREPWRRFVQEALQAQARFRQAIGGVSEGPLKERLAAIGARLDQGTREAWRVARRGQSLEDVRAQIDVAGVQAELAQLEAQAGERWAAGSSIERTAEALQAQLATAQRVDAVLADTTDRLRLLDARLDEAVARSLELSVRTEDPDQLGGVGNTVDEVLEEMEALRLALDEADGPPAPELPA